MGTSPHWASVASKVNFSNIKSPKPQINSTEVASMLESKSSEELTEMDSCILKASYFTNNNALYSVLSPPLLTKLKDASCS